MTPDPNDVDIIAIILRLMQKQNENTAQATAAISALTVAVTEKFPELAPVYERYLTSVEANSQLSLKVRQINEELERIAGKWDRVKQDAADQLKKQ